MNQSLIHVYGSDLTARVRLKQRARLGRAHRTRKLGVGGARAALGVAAGGLLVLEARLVVSATALEVGKETLAIGFAVGFASRPRAWIGRPVARPIAVGPFADDAGGIS